MIVELKNAVRKAENFSIKDQKVVAQLIMNKVAAKSSFLRLAEKLSRKKRNPALPMKDISSSGEDRKKKELAE